MPARGRSKAKSLDRSSWESAHRKEKPHAGHRERHSARAFSDSRASSRSRRNAVLSPIESGPGSEESIGKIVRDDGPCGPGHDIYAKLLGPTADETILCGLQLIQRMGFTQQGAHSDGDDSVDYHRTPAIKESSSRVTTSSDRSSRPTVSQQRIYVSEGTATDDLTPSEPSLGDPLSSQHIAIKASEDPTPSEPLSNEPLSSQHVSIKVESDISSKDHKDDIHDSDTKMETQSEACQTEFDLAPANLHDHTLTRTTTDRTITRTTTDHTFTDDAVQTSTELTTSSTAQTESSELENVMVINDSNEAKISTEASVESGPQPESITSSGSRLKGGKRDVEDEIEADFGEFSESSEVSDKKPGEPEIEQIVSKIADGSSETRDDSEDKSSEIRSRVSDPIRTTISVKTERESSKDFKTSSSTGSDKDSGKLRRSSMSDVSSSSRGRSYRSERSDRSHSNDRKSNESKHKPSASKSKPSRITIAIQTDSEFGKHSKASSTSGIDKNGKRRHRSSKSSESTSSRDSKDKSSDSRSKIRTTLATQTSDETDTGRSRSARSGTVVGDKSSAESLKSGGSKKSIRSTDSSRSKKTVERNGKKSSNAQESGCRLQLKKSQKSILKDSSSSSKSEKDSSERISCTCTCSIRTGHEQRKNGTCLCCSCGGDKKSKGSSGKPHEKTKTCLKCCSKKESCLRITETDPGEKIKLRCNCYARTPSTISEVGVVKDMKELEKGDGNRPVGKVKYAITKITDFGKFTTYEVMKSTRRKPKTMPVGLEGVFVLRRLQA